MASLETRHRAGYLFLATVIAHIVLISAQVNSRSGVPILETATVGVFAEIQRATTLLFDGVRSAWNGYVDLRNVRAENHALRDELARARVEMQQQRALAGRANSLEATLSLAQTLGLQTAAARIIGAAANADFRTVTIDKGSSQGVHANMAVIAPTGVVGRVVVAGPRASRVQLIVDRSAAAGAMVERSRAQGVVFGGGDELLRLQYLSQTADVVPGDAIVSSGIDGIYPKGLLIGRVEAVERGAAYPVVKVRGAVDVNNLEDLLVVLTPVPAATEKVGDEGTPPPEAVPPTGAKAE